MLWILCCLTQILAYGVKASECTLPSVEDICVYGNDKPFISDGVTFEFFVYDATTNTNVYFCEECWGSSVSSAYLYAWIYSNTNDYYWLIGPDHQSGSAWSSCYVGNALGPNYIFDIKNCLNVNNWFTYNGMEWNNDIGMSLSICNPICYETDICPQTNTQTWQTIKTAEKINIKIDTSTSWNGDIYFDFSIYEEDCMNPQLSFEYELIDYNQIYKNIKIYDNNDTLIATCNGGQSCGTFDSCLIDYDINDIIQINETYSIMIHQTADINNLCGDYILNAVLTLTCIPDNITTSIISSTLENQCGKREDIITTWFTSTLSSSHSSTSSTKTIKVKKKKTNNSWSYITGIGCTILLISAYCMYKCTKTRICGTMSEETCICGTILLIICYCCYKCNKKNMDQDKADKSVKKQPQNIAMPPRIMVVQKETIIFVKTP